MEHRKELFTIGVVKHWNKLLREVVDAPPGKIQSQVGQGFEQPDPVKMSLIIAGALD